MEQIQFAVSAKMARLIGRENISDVDSAVIELIKNAYDADATCAFVKFSMPFPVVPNTIPAELATAVFDKEGLRSLLRFYDFDEVRFKKKNTLSQNDITELETFLSSKNKIIIVDNGTGMDKQTLCSAWMNIGTSDKEHKSVSAKGRVKTGAKGIGRFALDKLSTITTVYTKNSCDTLLRWSINWNQFETANLLDEVKASLDNADGNYKTLAKEIIGDRIASFDNYKWDSGTIIELSPTREPWSVLLFNRINKNLKSLFPDTNTCDFDIYVDNEYYPECSFNNERFLLQESEYDYKISATFDGFDQLHVVLHRNEIDTRKLKVKRQYAGKEFELSLSEFWSRYPFEKDGFHRSDFAKTTEKTFSASNLLSVSKDKLESVGPFSTELYFIKSSNSPVEIVKQIITSKRKEILKNYSGIKLYRDGFKVRPYGEDGPAYDWLGLGVRAQRSPASVAHPTGRWRVLPYQIIGAVRITRESNINLYDMANREGLNQNEEYFLFVKILEKVIETFEGDRQIVYREYAKWLKEEELKRSSTEKIVNEIKSNKNDHNEENAEKNTGTNNNQYSCEEYKQAVSDLSAEKERQQRATQTMMLFSSAGVMTNTFAHEIERVAANVGYRTQHLRATVNLLLGHEGYVGDPDLNPLTIIDEAEKTDKLLESWINILMDGVNDGDKYIKSEIHPKEIINRIIGLWEPLLLKKYIYVKKDLSKISDDTVLSMAAVDLHIIFNNFFLNSAWFLESAKVDKREINIIGIELDSKIVLQLENNGPPLDPVFENNPSQIFDAGVSTKTVNGKKGSGIGLWITKTIVDDNAGDISPIVKGSGFGLKLSLPK